MQAWVTKLLKNNKTWWVIWPVWAVACYYGSLLVAGLILRIMYSMGAASPLSSTFGSLAFEAVIYVIMLALLVSLPLYKKHLNKKELGIQRALSWTDIGLGLAGYVIYFIVFIAVTMALSKLLPIYNAAQPQDLGFTVLVGPERLIGFLLFVVVAPLAEELMMRGFLYGKLRKAKLPFWPAALIVSVMFGLAHGQWNVGIDTFILSMVACYLRESTGTIWPGFIIHMTKNLVAYILLFVVMIK